MKIVGHYNVLHVPKTVRVVVLDVLETEKACNRVSHYEDKTTIARREIEDVFDQIIVEFSDVQTFNFDLKNMNYPLWFYDRIFFEVIRKEPIQYFVSERPSDISERIQFPLQSEPFQSVLQENQTTRNFTVDMDDVEYGENYKLMLLKILELEEVDLTNDDEISDILSKFNSIQEYLQEVKQ